jgi:sulfide:quinone oxidoreductase
VDPDQSLFPPRAFAVMLPNLFGDWLKVLVEKMLMLKYRPTNGADFGPRRRAGL